jgi:hypothetical protein
VGVLAAAAIAMAWPTRGAYKAVEVLLLLLLWWWCRRVAAAFALVRVCVATSSAAVMMLWQRLHSFSTAGCFNVTTWLWGCCCCCCGGGRERLRSFATLGQFRSICWAEQGSGNSCYGGQISTRSHLCGSGESDYQLVDVEACCCCCCGGRLKGTRLPGPRVCACVAYVLIRHNEYA